MVKSFCDGSTLAGRLADRLAKARLLYEFSEVGIAVHPGELELVNTVLNVNVPVIFRSDKSSKSDKLIDIFDFLENMTSDYIMWINGSNPILKPETIAGAASYWFCDKPYGCTAVKVNKSWMWDGNRNILSFAKSGKTQDSEVFYEATHSFHIFSRRHLLTTGEYWIDKGPDLFVVDKIEATDIDTEDDFRYADYLISQGA